MWRRKKMKMVYFSRMDGKNLQSDHSLELGNFIVFRCNRNSSFDVKIFGNNGCMKEEDLAYKCVNEETPTAEKTAIPVKNESEEVDTSPKPTRNFKRKSSEVNMKRSEKTGGTGSNAVSRRKSPRIGSKTIEQHGTFDSSEFSKPTNPHFVASIQPASFYRLNIPKDFLDKYGIKMEPEMVLRNQEGKLWAVDVTFPKNGQITLSKGWMDFQKENGLGFDDKCIFEFVFHKRRRLSREIQVRILRATENKIPSGVIVMDLQLKVIAVAEERGEIRSEMKGPKSVFGYICYFIFFIPVFFFLCVASDSTKDLLEVRLREGLRSSLMGACTIVRDFKDFSFHSFFSVTDELMKAKGEEPIELKVLQIPGCFLAAFIGILVDVPVISVITLYKAPILLFKGWYRLLVYCLALVMDVMLLLLHTRKVLHGEGLLYVVASAALFDEYTNDLLYLREGSCFPRPRYREHVGSSSSLPRVNSLHEQQHEGLHGEEPLIGPPSVKTKTLQAVVIWDGFIKGCGDIGKELLRVGAIGIVDLDAWKDSRNKIVNIGIPAYAFLECFLYSIKSGSPGFLLRDNVEITRVNRPEGRIFDWLYEPMKSWQNGGVPPQDEIKRAQLEGIARRLQGFCLTLSRMPTSRRRFYEVVKAIEQEEESPGGLGGGNDGIEAGA
ncbi:hypothetical protein Acr_00g0009390 [Actinidia rufa]|uniref:TF-B3 domain-containing protein n=1 Tax=Actinidia rufa TaxID=165716 RepID=A0A7J0D8W6_9ERIC|nr:hypothetical protein Acr_00g0009390 [Actinidia rufa]